MVEIEEYIRLARNQGINKIIEIDDFRYILDKDIGDEYGDPTCVLEEYQLKDEILKHSKNLIDLVELYDIVNGLLVIDIFSYPNGKKEIKLVNGLIIEDKDIFEILTHEEYRRDCFER